MNNFKRHGKLRREIARVILVSGFVAWSGLAGAQGWQLSSNVTLKADLTLKETFDSNVYLQDVEPNPAITNAALPFQESFVTSVTPRVGLDVPP